MLNPLFCRERLTESLTLSVSQNTQHKTNYLSLFFLLPLEEKTAAAAAVLAHLITDATAEYPEPQLLRRAKAALYGAEISASTSTVGETLVFSLTAAFLKDRYALAQESILTGVMAFCRSFLQNPKLVDGVFDPALCALEIKNAADDARATLNDKSRLARRRHIEAMYRGEPFATDSLGRAEDIEALSPALLTDAFYHLLKTAPVEAIFVGEADEELLKHALLSCFDALQGTPFSPPMPEVGTAPERRVELVDKMDIKQAHLCLGLRSSVTRRDEEYFAFSVANTVFGAGTTSKLFMNVREKLSLCYRVASIFEAQKGFLQIYAGIDSEKQQAATDEILLQLSDTQKTAITDEELQNAKNTLKNATRTYTSSPDTIAAWSLPRILSGVEVSPELEIERVEKITKEEAASAFSRLTEDTFYCLKQEEA